MKKNKENFKGEFFYLITPVRLLRNAAAHNNCLLIDLVKAPDLSFDPEYTVCTFLGKNGIKNTTINKQMSKPVINDFCVLLYLYSLVAPLKAQQHAFEELKDFFDNRIIKHKEYYKNNSILLSAYDFMKKVIDIFYESSQNV